MLNWRLIELLNVLLFYSCPVSCLFWWQNNGKILMAWSSSWCLSLARMYFYSGSVWTQYALFPQTQHTNETNFAFCMWSDWLEILCEEVKCWEQFSCCCRSKTGCCSKGFYSFIIQNVGRKSNTNLIFLFVCSSSLYWYFLSILLAASVIAVEIIGFNVKAEFLIKHFFLFVSWSKSNFGDPWMNIFLMKTDPSCSTWYKENGG